MLCPCFAYGDIAAVLSARVHRRRHCRAKQSVRRVRPSSAAELAVQTKRWGKGGKGRRVVDWLLEFITVACGRRLLGWLRRKCRLQADEEEDHLFRIICFMNYSRRDTGCSSAQTPRLFATRSFIIDQRIGLRYVEATKDFQLSFLSCPAWISHSMLHSILHW